MSPIDYTLMGTLEMQTTVLPKDMVPHGQPVAPLGRLPLYHR